MEPSKRPLVSKNMILGIFAVAFAALYISSNSNIIALGFIGITLVVLSAIIVLVTK